MIYYINHSLTIHAHLLRFDTCRKLATVCAMMMKMKMYTCTAQSLHAISIIFIACSVRSESVEVIMTEILTMTGGGGGRGGGGGGGGKRSAIAVELMVK